VKEKWGTGSSSAQMLSFRIFVELLEQTIQFGFRFEGLVRFHERLELLFHRLSDD
jgi:hypothetical protein